MGGRELERGSVVPLSPLWGEGLIQTPLVEGKIDSPEHERSFTTYRGDDIVSSSLITLFQRQSGATEEWVNGLAVTSPSKPQKELLHVEFTIKCINSYRHMRESKFVMEMKVGGKRLYVVNDIGEFLSHIEAGEPHTFTKLFTYDPSLHEFSPGDLELIKKLIDIHNSEFAYQETGLVTSGHRDSRSKGNKRQLTIPPLVWKEIILLLVQPDQNVLIEQENGATRSFKVEDGVLPITFAISKVEGTEDYQMNVEGLHDCIIMSHYGCVVTDGRVIMLGESEVRTIGELWRLLYSKGDKPLHISTLQMDSFIEHVVPGLRRLGKVDMDKQIECRIIETGLRAKIVLGSRWWCATRHIGISL